MVTAAFLKECCDHENTPLSGVDCLVELEIGGENVNMTMSDALVIWLQSPNALAA